MGEIAAGPRRITIERRLKDETWLRDASIFSSSACVKLSSSLSSSEEESAFGSRNETTDPCLGNDGMLTGEPRSWRFV